MQDQTVKRVTGRFANVLCRSSKKRNERCACICFVVSAMIQNVRYACIYLVLSATYQAKAVEELTPHVYETTSQVGEEDVGETTRRRNDRKPLKEIYEFEEGWGS